MVFAAVPMQKAARSRAQRCAGVGLRCGGPTGEYRSILPTTRRSCRPPTSWAVLLALPVVSLHARKRGIPPWAIRHGALAAQHGTSEGGSRAIVLLFTSIDLELTRAARAAAGARRQPLSAGAPPANAFSAAALSEPRLEVLPAFH